MVNKYNQSDPEYKNVMLGVSSKYTLFSDGCYVINLSYILGIDPIACNESLKAVDAFKADNTGDKCLLDHTKIRLAFPDRIEDVEKVDTYDNDKCLDALEKYGKVIIKVDYDGNTASALDTHFVTFIGNKQLFDSLGGKVKPTSTYPILKGMRIVKIKPPAPVVPTDPDKIKVDLGDLGQMEIGVIKSTIKDLRRDLESAKVKLDGFVEKWFEEYKLRDDPDRGRLVILEQEMNTHLPLEQDYLDLVEVGEGIVGHFDSKTAFKEALGAVKTEIETKRAQIADLTAKLADANIPSGYKISKSWSLFKEKYLFKMYRREVIK